MKNNHNPMKGFFKRNQDNKYPKNTNSKRNYQSKLLTHASDDGMQYNKRKEKACNQREVSELDNVYIQHMQKIQNEIEKLVRDVQYLDSKNPSVSSQMRSILVDLIINAWKIGNIVTSLKEENELAEVSALLSKYEKDILKAINESEADSATAGELKSLKKCQSIINNSSHQINSMAEYYNILLSKLSDWGFEIRDPTGQEYDIHLDMDIIAFEDPDPDQS